MKNLTIYYIGKFENLILLNMLSCDSTRSVTFHQLTSRGDELTNIDFVNRSPHSWGITSSVLLFRILFIDRLILKHHLDGL